MSDVMSGDGQVWAAALYLHFTALQRLRSARVSAETLQGGCTMTISSLRTGRN